MGKLDLKTAFPGLRSRAEYFQDQRGAVENLGGPGFFQIALLHRAQLMINNDEAGLVDPHQGGDFINLASSNQRCGSCIAQWNVDGRGDLHADRFDKPDGFAPPRLGVASRSFLRFATALRPQRGQQYDSRLRSSGSGIGRAGFQSVFRLVLAALIMAQSGLCRLACLVGIPVEKLNGLSRHDRGNRMLVDKLRMPIAPEQNAEIIKPGDNSL